MHPSKMDRDCSYLCSDRFGRSGWRRSESESSLPFPFPLSILISVLTWCNSSNISQFLLPTLPKCLSCLFVPSVLSSWHSCPISAAHFPLLPGTYSHCLMCSFPPLPAAIVLPDSALLPVFPDSASVLCVPALLTLAFACVQTSMVVKI